MSEAAPDQLLPAICDHCGQVWVPPAIALGPGASNIAISNVSVSPCPSCGGVGHIPDGVYEGTESGVRLVSRLDAAQRRAVGEVFERAQREQLDATELARAIDELAVTQADGADAIRAIAERFAEAWWWGSSTATGEAFVGRYQQDVCWVDSRPPPHR